MTKFLVRFTDTLAIIFILFGLVYSLILKPEPVVAVSDSSYRSDSQYKEAAAKYLQPLKNQNKITVDESEVTEGIMRSFPEVDTASVRLPIIGQTPRIEIAVSPPSLFLHSQGKVFILDERGRIIGLAGDFPRVKGLQTVKDESGFTAETGKQILNSSATTFIKLLSAQMKKSNVAIESLSLPAVAYELHFRPAGSSYYVKFFLNGEPSQQIGQFLSARQHFSANNINPAEYLDVRVQGKIFYK